MKNIPVTHIIAVANLDGSDCEVITSANGHEDYKAKFAAVAAEITASGEHKDLYIYTRTNKARIAPGRIAESEAQKPALKDPFEGLSDEERKVLAEFSAELHEKTEAELHEFATGMGIDHTQYTTKDQLILALLGLGEEKAPQE